MSDSSSMNSRMNSSSSTHDSLGDRMKLYEGVSKTRLVPKIPVLIRLDGKAFHTFTRGMTRPYDGAFHACMWTAAQALCEQISGCKIAYVQSDEITLLLTDYASTQTQPWFGYEVQKLCSVSAGICSVAFLDALRRLGMDFKGLPSFDARCWNVPREEVVNAFIWRQQDATRNSVSMLAQAHFSHQQLYGVSMAGMQDLLMSRGVNWNDCPPAQKRGVCIVRETYQIPVEGQASVTRHRWVVDPNTPIFTQDRDYIDQHVQAG